MRVTFLLATRNRHKVREFRRIFKKGPIRFITLDACEGIPAVRETGKTFRANAVKKAVQNSRHTALPVIAEDSGFEVKALGGRPGVKSARFALRRAQGERTSDEIDQANLDKLVRLMRKVPVPKRQARFVCAIAVAYAGKLLKTVEESCAGSVAVVPAGKTGFGYDPVFIPRGYSKTNAQLGARVKDSISHRARALRRLAPFIKGFREYPAG